MLHVTNGESVSLDRSGLGGEVLAWIDVLHEGPVPAGLGLNDLTRLRAKFLDGAWPGARSAAETLSNRDAALGRFTEHEEVVLWFEHDLYDQLQLIQILDWFHAPAGAVPRLSLICIDGYLGRLTGPQLAGLWPRRHAVTAPELQLARSAWQAFRAPDPSGIEELLRGDTAALPFLAGALLRHLQQFPWVENGLSRTERQILELVEAGQRDFASLFAADQRARGAHFHGRCQLRAVRKRALRVPASAAGQRERRIRSDAHRPRSPGFPRRPHPPQRHQPLARRRALNGAEALWRWDERRRRLAPY